MLDRIIIHWSAGQNLPNAVDRNNYHYLVDGEGNILSGKYKPEDNINCKDGKYAEHTGGGNTGSIGISMCGMLGFKDKNHVGRFPLTEKQCESAFKSIAKLCKDYGIPVTPQTVMTHKEFGDAHPKTSSHGKIDICYLPPYPEVTANDIGEFIRNKVKWYIGEN